VVLTNLTGWSERSTNMIFSRHLALRSCKFTPKPTRLLTDTVPTPCVCSVLLPVEFLFWPRNACCLYLAYFPCLKKITRRSGKNWFPAFLRYVTERVDTDHVENEKITRGNADTQTATWSHNPPVHYHYWHNSHFWDIAFLRRLCQVCLFPAVFRELDHPVLTSLEFAAVFLFCRARLSAISSLYLCPPVAGCPRHRLHFCRLLRLARLRWRYSNPPPHRNKPPLFFSKYEK
jgi:hypothetical protein